MKILKKSKNMLALTCFMIQASSIWKTTEASVSPVVQPFAFPESASIGQRITATCGILQGSKTLTFMWLKDGKDVTSIPNTSVDMQAEYSVLTIVPASKINVGNYTCVVKNAFGEDRHTAVFLLKEAPTWINEPQDVTGVEGEHIEIKCLADGLPKPEMKWTKLEGDSNVAVQDSTNRFANKSLIITSLKSEFAGAYTCEAENGIGKSIKKSVKVHVNVPARFEEKFQVQTVRQGESPVLRCDVTGDQPINIVWYKDKRELEITELSRYEKFETSSKNGVNSELFIRNADRRDGALYSCTASNTYGSDEKNIKVLVVEVPAQPLDVKVLDVWARSANIRWSAPYTGNSAITLYRVQYWRDKHGPQTLNEEEISASQTSAIIQGLKPGTSYALAVVAENEIGHGEPSETIRFVTSEEEPNGPPTDLNVEARGPTSILVKWKPPPKECWNGELKGYYVGYRPEGMNHPYTFKGVEASANDSNEYLITGLTKSARYSVLVKAYNKAGNGPPSQELVIRTLDGDLPKSPPISLVRTSDTEITVKWNQVVNRDDPLTGNPNSGDDLH